MNQFNSKTMTKICTTIEQSKKLVKLGIDVNTSDCSWILSPNGSHYTLSLTAPMYCDIPAWSLTALLGLMPKDESKTISLCLGGSNGMEHTFDWFCTCDENDEPYDYKTFHSSDPIDCTFEMVVWLKENGKI